MRFQLNIELNNDAMITGEDIVFALRGVIENLEGGSSYTEQDNGDFTLLPTAKNVIASNGDIVGKWVIFDDDAT